MSRDIAENKISKILSGKLTNASGAINDDADIRIPGFLIECKRRETTKGKIVFYTKVWEKLRKQSIKTCRIPLYIFQAKGDSYCITWLNAIEDLIRGKHIGCFNINVKCNIKSNVIIKVDDFNDVYKGYTFNKFNVATFKYNNITFGIIDLDALYRLTKE